MAQASIELAGQVIAPGQKATVLLPVAETYLRQDARMPVHVFHGRRPGPRLFVCAAIHGDELNGIEVVRRLTSLKRLSSMAGTLFAVPVVNLYGFMGNSRYLPDRRDLNRFFPGAKGGSLASELAQVLFKNVVSYCDYGIDLHTGSNHRRNLPHLRGDMSDPEVLAMARAFGAPLALESPGAKGSLRGAAVAKGVKMLTYEAGEALRLDEVSIKAGVRGLTSVMEHLGMLSTRKRSVRSSLTMQVALNSSWVRATMSGLLQSRVKLGQLVSKDQILGFIHDPFGTQSLELTSPRQGVVIGLQSLPSVYKGDALVHLGSFEAPAKAEALVDEFSELMNQDSGLA
ncbi:succinylglutamate desuccinylase/aspartoacylase family protein [Desulfovibrio ferrophilus]|nr:succinylglutamate desuccinylase/aspartoacylase family protein [Desulfovibrio ferrophilus]